MDPIYFHATNMKSMSNIVVTPSTRTARMSVHVEPEYASAAKARRRDHVTHSQLPANENTCSRERWRQPICM